MTLTRSPITPANVNPSIGDLWEAPYTFLANWVTPPVLRSAFTTDIHQAKTAAEERFARSGKPSRILEYTITAMREGEGVKANWLLARQGSARFLTPLYTDMPRVAVATPPAGSVLTLLESPALFRLFVGGRVLVALPRARQSIIPTTHLRYITAIDPGAKTITLDIGIAPGVLAGARVYPLMETELSIRSDFGPHTDTMLSARVESIEVLGRTQLPALQAANTIPDNTPTAGDGLPIFNFRPAWPRIGQGWTRDGSYSPLGRGRVLFAQGSRARATQAYPVQCINRAESMRLVRFFESRAGACFPFWILEPMANFVAVSATSTTITVRSPAEVFDWNFSTHVGIVKRDGSQLVRGITGFTRADGLDVLTLDAPIDFGLSDMRRVTSARKVRFAMNELAENWQTDQHMIADVSFIELLREQSVTMGMGQPDGTPGTAPWALVEVCCDPPPGEPGPIILAPLRYTRCDDFVYRIFFDQEHDPLAPVVKVDGICYFRDGVDAEATATNPTVEQTFEDCVICIGEEGGDDVPFSPTIRYQHCEAFPVESIYFDMLHDPVVGAIRVEEDGPVTAGCYSRQELGTTAATSPVPAFAPAGATCVDCSNTLKYIPCEGETGDPVYFSSSIGGLTNVLKIGGICYVADGTSTEPPSDPSVTDMFDECDECNNAVHYQLCAGQESATPDLYYSREDDPEAAVIKVGGKCYQRVGLTESETFNGTPPDETFEDCEPCVGGDETPCNGGDIDDCPAVIHVQVIPGSITCPAGFAAGSATHDLPKVGEGWSTDGLEPGSHGHAWVIHCVGGEWFFTFDAGGGGSISLGAGACPQPGTYTGALAGCVGAEEVTVVISY